MAAKREAITYTFRPLPRGGEVRIQSKDPEAIRAIHEFLAFQRQDHRTIRRAYRSHDATGKGSQAVARHPSTAIRLLRATR